MIVQDGKRFIQADNIVCCDLEGGKALLDTNNSQYYKLNETAALVWEQLADERTVAELADELCKRFKVQRALAVTDLNNMLGAFSDAKLVSILT